LIEKIKELEIKNKNGYDSPKYKIKLNGINEGINKCQKIYENKNEGGNHPPKNKITAKVDITTIFAYSPIKNKAKLIEEYSTL